MNLDGNCDTGVFGDHGVKSNVAVDGLFTLHPDGVYSLSIDGSESDERIIEQNGYPAVARHAETSLVFYANRGQNRAMEADGTGDVVDIRPL